MSQGSERGAPSIFTFEDFELDELRFELRHRGQLVRTQPKVLRLLFYLARHHQRCVTTQELLQELWPSERVTTASLKRAIGGARRALGGDAGSQASIRTVRGRGYQFVRPLAQALEVCASSAPRAEMASDALFGRQQVLRQLAARLAQARAGRGQLVLLSGEPGVGKTRLLHELALQAAHSGVPAWFGRCTNTTGAPALWPFVQMLRAAAAELPMERMLEAMGSGAADIAALMPELRRIFPTIAPSQEIDASAERFRFFDSFTCFLGRIAAREALCLLLDDLQYADALTIALLCFLSQQLDRSQLLVVATLRAGPDQDTVTSPLRQLQHSPVLHEIELSGLSADELTSWLVSRYGSAVSPQLVTGLHEQTAGNPLFIERMLHSFAEHSLDGLQDALTQRVAPQRLQRAIEQHLGRLGAETRACLQVASVFGAEFTVGTLAQVLVTPATELTPQLSAAADAGLVRVLEPRIGHYTFAHGLIRAALYEQLSQERRAQLHGLAARALEARSAGSELQLPQIAEHFLRAAPNHDGGRAVPTAWRAAQAAALRCAFEEAASFLERARAVLELGPPDPRAQLELLLAQGEALAHAGDAHAARTLLFDAAYRARELGAHELVVRAAMALAEQPETGSIDPARIELIEDALQRLRVGDPRFACLQALYAKALTYSHDRATCTRLARAAWAAVPTLSDPALRRRTLTACWHGFAEPDCLIERQQIAEALAREGHAHHDHRALLWSAVARVGCAMELGDMADVAAAVANISALAEQVREPFFRWHVLTFRAMQATLAAQLSEAERLTEAAYQSGLRLGASGARHVYCTQLSAIRRLQGRLDEAEQLVREVSLAHPGVAGWQAVLASIEAEQGPTEQPRRVLQRLLERNLEALRSDPFALSVIAATADLCLVVGDATLARPVYQALRPYETRHGSISIGIGSHGPLARHLGRLAFQMHDFELAERHFAKALALSEAMPSPVFTSLSLLGYAHLLLVGQSNAGERANAMISRAARLAQTHHLDGVLRHTEALSRLSRGRALSVVKGGEPQLRSGSPKTSSS